MTPQHGRPLLLTRRFLQLRYFSRPWQPFKVLSLRSGRRLISLNLSEVMRLNSIALPDLLSVPAYSAHHSISWKTDAIALVRQYLRVSPPRPESDRGSSMSSGNDSGKNSKKVDSRTGGDGGGEETGPIEDAAESMAPRVTLLVIVAFIVFTILWYMAKPKGAPVGWATLRECVADIDSIALYDQYAQVYLNRETNNKMYVGLVNDPHTHERIEELKQLYATGRSEEVKAFGKGEDEDESFLQHRHKELPVFLKGRPVAETALQVLGVLAYVAPFIFIPYAWGVMVRNKVVKQMGSITKSVNPEMEKVTFKIEIPASTRFRDVAGMKEPKQEITEIVDFLKFPKRYTDLGAKIPSGALLLGPPGTGKTLLAKAVSGESGVSFIPACGSDFVELYAGMGAKRVRELFDLAKKQRCIIYIDEIDAIGLKREGAGHGEKQEQEHTLNELLSQLDGFATENRTGDVILLASSNVPLSALDPALVRPGRFDRIIHVDPPVKKERIEVFQVHLCKLKLVAEPKREDLPRNTTSSDNSQATVIAEKSSEGTSAEEPKDVAVKTEGQSSTASATGIMANTTCTALVPVEPVTVKAFENVNSFEDLTRIIVNTIHGVTENALDIASVLETKTEEERRLIESYAYRMSELCPGFVGSDIANVCNEAAILAAQEESSVVTISHLERSIDRVLAGIEHRSRALSDFEKKVVAHHEAGHAVAGWFLNRADPLMKVSIVPRGGSALGYAQYLPNENRNKTAHELRDSISVTLGGRIAEKIFFDHLSTGASDDLDKVRHMAYQYVTFFADKILTVYPTPDSEQLQYRKPYSPEKADQYDELAMQLVNQIYEETYTLLLEHKHHMSILAEHLLREEVLTHHDVVAYLGVRLERESDKKPIQELRLSTA